MLVPLLCTAILSTQLGLSLVAKSMLLLLLGQGNPPSDLTSMSVNRSDTITTDSMNFILGTYSLESSSNFDSYLQEMGVSYFLRQLAQLAQPEVTFGVDCSGDSDNTDIDMHNTTSDSDDDDAPGHTDNISLSSPSCVWSIHTDAGIKIHDIAFTIGKEVEDITMDGREITTKFLMPKPNTLVEEQIGESTHTTLTRNFYKEEMEVIMEVNGVIAQSMFKRKTE